MNKKIKKTLMKSIIQNNTRKFIRTLDNFDLVLDESYFDYELLKVALDNERENFAKILIRKGCRVRNPNKINLEETPLHLAMKLEDLSVISAILINNDASINDKNLKGETPLHAAFKQKYYSAVTVVLDYISICNLSFKPDNNDDVLHFHIACIRKHIDSVKLYLTFGFDVNSYLSVDEAEFSGLTPLHYLVSKKDYGDLFKILLEHSDLSIKNSDGLTPLHSIYYNCTDFLNIMFQVFEHGNNTKFNNAVDKSGVSHFHLCCLTNHPDWVQVFINNGADINCSISLNSSRKPGYTPLHFAARYACVEVVELLLKNGADCNKPDKNGATSLHSALHSASEIIESDAELKIIEMLLDHSASPLVVDRFGNTPVHLMFNGMMHHASEQVSVLDKLISKIPQLVNLTDKRGVSFFHIFCTRNYPDRVNDYLNSGVAIDSVSDSVAFPGYSALHLAVAFNQKDVVELLLKRNAQVNIKSVNLDTPLHLACEYTRLTFYEVDCEYEEKQKTNDKLLRLDWSSNRTKQIDIIKLLLLYGADVEAKNFSGFTPLFSAFRFDEDLIDYWEGFCNDMMNEINTRLIEIINILLSNKASINSYENDNQESIFHVICRYDLPQISDAVMECLLTAGADINAVDRDGLTPLHVAARWNRKEWVKSFLKHKANVNVKCKKNQTPLELAIKVYKGYENAFRNEDKLKCKSSQSSIRILLKKGSDVNVRSTDGRSLLHEAVSASSTFLIENLLNHGADINVEDSSGNSPVYSLFTNAQINNISISCIIFIHVQKLLALGLYVSDKVQNFCNYLHRYCKSLVSESNYDSIWNVFDQCIDELNQMKMKKIDNYTTLYDFLLKKSQDLSKHVRNRTLIKIVKSQDVVVTFQLYGYLLKVQYKKGLLRRNLLRGAKTSLIYVTSSNLPDACYDSILRYLTNEEIVNLKAAADKKSKRKLSDNYSNDTEPSTKLQKTSET